MAVKTLQVTQTGSARSVAAAGTYARWILFANNAAAAMAIGDANVSLTLGAPLIAAGSFFLPPMPPGCQYDLGQFYTIGTNTQNLAIIYDSMK